MTTSLVVAVDSASATAFLFAAEDSVSPAGALNTTCAVAPSVVACGERSLIRANALVDSTPLSSNVSEVVPDSVTAPTAIATSSPTHAVATSLRCRNDHRPSRNRCHAMSGPFVASGEATVRVVAHQVRC